MKFLLLTILGTIFCSSINAGQFYNFNGAQYYFSYPLQKNWFQAMRFCGFYNMQLLSIDSREENNFIAGVIRNTPDYFKITSYFWTSGIDFGDNGKFYWATHGNKMQFTDWAPGEPNHYRDEDCVALRGVAGFKWNDSRCEYFNYFICEPKSCPK